MQAQLEKVEADKAEAKRGDIVDERQAKTAEEQEAYLKAQLQVHLELDSLPDEEKATAHAAAAPYAVLSDPDVDANRGDAYVAALACLLSGKMSDLENVPTPPGPMTKNKCEMLRKGERPILLKARPLLASLSKEPGCPAN